MRLIDADVVKPKIKEIIMFAPNVLMNLELAIDNAQTIDAVVHGEWVENKACDCCYVCSVCNFLRDAYLLDNGNFCPNCGARMEVEP
jgi:rubrerythrin